MDLELPSRTSAQLPLLGLSDDHDLGTAPGVTLLSHHVYNQRVVLSLRVSDPCYARLAYAYYPYLEVRVNGVQVEPLVTADRFIALQLDKGEHVIVLEPFLSPLRKGLLWLDLIALSVMALVVIVSGRCDGGDERAGS